MAAGFGLFVSEEALNVWVCPLYWYPRLCSSSIPTLFRTCTTLYLFILHSGFIVDNCIDFFMMQVGISLARTLCLDGTWQSLVNSFSTNASYIISTVLWVYWYAHPLSSVYRPFRQKIVQNRLIEIIAINYPFVQGCLYQRYGSILSW